MQLRGPGVAGYIFRFGVITPSSLAERRLGGSTCFAMPALKCPSDRSRSILPLNSNLGSQSSTVNFAGGVRQARREAIESGTGGF
jgi:hypothetical protein